METLRTIVLVAVVAVIGVSALLGWAVIREARVIPPDPPVASIDKQALSDETPTSLR